MDKKITDKHKFPCPQCSEHLTTLQNLKRHITRKHKDIDLTPQEDNISVLSESTVSEVKSETVPEKETKMEIPTTTYLINLRNEYRKYEYLYEKIDRDERWIKNNRDIDMIRYYQKHNRFVKCILTDIKDLYAKPIDG